MSKRGQVYQEARDTRPKESLRIHFLTLSDTIKAPWGGKALPRPHPQIKEIFNYAYQVLLFPAYQGLWGAKIAL